MKGSTDNMFNNNILKLLYDKSDDLESIKTEVLVCLVIISGLSRTDDEVDINFNAKFVPVIEAKENFDDVTISEKLPVEQKQQLGQLLFEYSDILTDDPLVTNVIEQTAKTKRDEPVYKKWHF